MSRRRVRRQRLRRQRIAAGPLRVWTISRASAAGIACGIAAILLAGLFDTGGGALLHAYAVLLAVTALSGASILWITALDMRARGTSGRMRPIRGFDGALGLALLLPSLYALSRAWPALGL